MDILDKIIAAKKEVIARRKLLVDITMLQERTNCPSRVSPLRSFAEILRHAIQKQGIAIIAELKRASPSKGMLAQDYKPADLALDYERHGATCLSVVTEEQFFFGCNKDLELAREKSSLPVLRKDFIVDSYQIYESKYYCADCILLIAAALPANQLVEFYDLAKQLKLDVLIEVANEDELETALRTEATLVGINNRNLRNFDTNLQTTIDLSKEVPKDRTVICESGIKNRDDIKLLLDHDVHAFLVGEALITAQNPGEKLAELLSHTSPA